MGYRSEVIIAIKHEAYQKEILIGKGCSLPFHNASRYCPDNEVYYWHFSGIKWYEHHSEISYINELLTSISYEDYGFVRVGEDPEDIEIRGLPSDFDIYPQAYISFDQTILDLPMRGEKNDAA
mgnify:CR=1 FL=1